MAEFDKTKSCKDCPDRCVSPNCHSTCEGYLYRCEQNKQRREKERAKSQITDYKLSRIYETKRRVHHGNRYSRQGYRTI